MYGMSLLKKKALIIETCRLAITFLKLDTDTMEFGQIQNPSHLVLNSHGGVHGFSISVVLFLHSYFYTICIKFKLEK